MASQAMQTIICYFYSIIHADAFMFTFSRTGSTLYAINTLYRNALKVGYEKQAVFVSSSMYNKVSPH